MAGSNASNSVTKAKTGPKGAWKFTGEVLRKLEEAFAIGASDKEACFYADVSPSALYSYQEKNPKFVERKEALKERPVLIARQKVIKAIENNDMQTTRWFLERRKRLEFATNIDITSDGKELPAPILNMITAQIPSSDTNGDINPEIIDGEVSEKTGLDQIESKGNIMDDING